MRLGAVIALGVVVGLLLARHTATSTNGTVEARQTADPAAGSSTRAARTQTVPAATRRVPQRELQATDPRYDAFLLSMEREELTSKEIFEGEPRDPEFAPTLEKRTHAALAIAFRELEIEDKIVGVKTECKTLSCVTRVEVSRENGWDVYNAINGVMLGDVQEPEIDESDPERTYVTLANVYRASTRDDSEYQKFFRAATRPSLDAAKERLAKARGEARH